MEPHGFSTLGAIETELTGSEYQLKLGSATPRPTSLHNDRAWSKPVFYQRQLPTCGANAGAYIAEILDEDPASVYNPRYQWIDIKSIDGFALGDGTDMQSIFKSLTRGELPDASLDDDTTLSLTQYSRSTSVTPSMRKLAAKKAISAYAFHTGALTMDALKQLIFQYGALLLLIRIGDEFWTDRHGNGSWQEKDILPLRPSTSIVSGHFVVAHSYDEKYIYFANWWSADWGRKGHGYFGENYLPQVAGVGTMVDGTEAVIVPSFTRDLYLGVSDPQVKLLQEWLNGHGYPLAASGPGSNGRETEYFGNATQNAVVRFQRANGIAPTSGYFGPKTRSLINSKGA